MRPDEGGGEGVESIKEFDISECISRHKSYLRKKKKKDKKTKTKRKKETPEIAQKLNFFFQNLIK